MNITERLSFGVEKRSIPISLGELFACPTDSTDDRQVKGIYYDKAYKTFFLFVRRSVYSIPDDGNLIAKHFAKNLIEPHLNESAKPLHLSKLLSNTKENAKKGDTEDDTTRHAFELMATSWVKNLKWSSYLVPVPSTLQVFEIDYKRLVMREKFGEAVWDNRLGMCKGQTLQVDSSVFCFDEHQYYKLSGKQPKKFFNLFRLILTQLFSD